MFWEEVRVEEQSHTRPTMHEAKWTIGIESTAHTFSFGLVDPDGIPYPSVGDTIKPLEVEFTLEGGRRPSS